MFSKPRTSAPRPSFVNMDCNASQRGVRMCLVISAGESLVIRVMCRFGLAAAVQLRVSLNSPQYLPKRPTFPTEYFFRYHHGVFPRVWHVV